MKTIATSTAYKCEIYDGCTSRLVTHAGRYYVHKDGTKWIGNTSGFHVYKYKLTKEETKDALAMLPDHNAGVCDNLSDWLRSYPASEPAHF